jgi:SAM-dependent methyltransferase
MTDALYDQIGGTYALTRRPDPRIASVIVGALGDARTVLNVGAGTGSYEPSGRRVLAVEPSRRMMRQRRSGGAPVVQATAEALPFAARSFDAALAVLTLHHWTDWKRGLDEMRRVARRLVIVTIEPDDGAKFWLTQEYFPEITRSDQARCPSVAEIVEYLGSARVDGVAVPHDCIDGFLAAFWRRPEAYLDADIRAGISSFALLDSGTVERGVSRLKADLASGAWDRRFGHLRALDALEVCYRLIVIE